MHRNLPRVAFTLLSLVVLTMFSATAFATCFTCSNGHCVIVSGGHASCTDAYYPSEPWCKMACPDCPTGPCDWGGGGGGGGCDGGGFRLSPANGRTVVTYGVLFKSDAATNAKLFRGRGQAVRPLPGAVFGDFTADAILDQVANLGGRTGSQLHLAFAFRNYSQVGVPITLLSESGEGFTFAATTRGFGAELQLRPKYAARLDRRIDTATLQNGDAVMVDVKIRGEAYILVLHSEVLETSAPDFESRLQMIDQSFKGSVDRLRPGAEPMIMIIPC